MQTALVTGANGFIGRILCHELNHRGVVVHAAIRAMTPDRHVPHCKLYAVGDISGTTDWQQALTGVDTVFHLAATVHQPDVHDTKTYFTSIVAATRHLVEQAIAAGVKRFIYISTTKVYGKESCPTAISESDSCTPTDPYGSTKLAAEQLLTQLAMNTRLEWVIIRPPLVYGPEVKGNFQRLASLVRRFPIVPLGRANAPRSIISVENLVNFMITCATTPAADHQTFNITDGYDLSTAELCRLIAKSMKIRCWVAPIPVSWLALLLRVFGKEALLEKLFGRLCYDITRAKQLINWKPVVKIDSAIKPALRYVK